MIYPKRLFLCFVPFFALAVLLLSYPAHAGADIDIITAAPDAYVRNTTHDEIRLTMDKSELIRLDQDAASIVVGNPNHINVLAETSKLLVIVPRAPGATHISVLDSDSNVIMQRHVIVAGPKKKYVRIRRSCAGSNDDSCLDTQTYYCPDTCHAISPITTESDNSDAATSTVQSGADLGTQNEQGASGGE